MNMNGIHDALFRRNVGRHGRVLLAGAVAMLSSGHVAVAAGATSGGAPASVPVAAFFMAADMTEAEISPDGDALAVLVRNKAGRRQLAIIDTADLGKINIAVSFDDADVGNVEWVDDKRLIFNSWHEESSAFDQRGAPLYAVDRDGGNIRTLITGDQNFFAKVSGIKDRALPSSYMRLRTLRDGSSDIVLAHWQHTSPIGGLVWQYTGSTPLRLDTRTGSVGEIIGGNLPDWVTQWVIDDHGHALAAVTSNEGRESVLVPERPGTWRELAHFDSYGQRKGGFNVLGVAADGKVYVTHSNGGADQADALYRMDLATGRMDADAMVSVKGFDVGARLVEDDRQHKVLGVHYEADAPGTAWFDPASKELQKRVDARLPGLINRIDLASCGCATRVLVKSFSDRQPMLYFLYDRSNDTLIPVGAARPAIVPSQMADTDFVRIKTRDGHEMPVYVTKPHGKGPWPTVVLVHGGPWLRGWGWRWDGESQFLASRGYLVVKPEMRGSAGYGANWFLAGLKQWGLAMQDDIADATTWAATAGLADPRRTCIAGASYGGYATLMGLVRYGDLYRCGVAWAAVTDIKLMYDIDWSDMGDDYRSFGMPVMVGDPVKDAAQLVATSPLQQAARITRPLLLAHGGIDRRVPIPHATQLRNALQANGAPLTWIEYPDEAHGWYKPETRIDFYQRMEVFLDANIGAGYKAAAESPKP